MPSMSERIKTVLSAMIPTRLITRWHPQNEPAALANQMDVDRVHQILRDAESGNVRELFALYRDVLLGDAHLQGEFTKRKLAVIGDPINFLAVDKKNADDVAASDMVLVAIEDCADFLMACSHLLDATLWPVAVVEKVFRPGRNGVNYEIDRLVIVPDQLLDYSTGKLMIRDTDDQGNPTGTLHAPVPNRYIVHRGHLLTQPDNWGGPLRSLLFWWLLSTMDRDWWARFLDRYGSPFLVGRYDQNDDDSRSILEQAFGFAVKVGGLVVSKDTEVEIKQAASSQSGDAYEKFLTICQREKSKLIVGHSMISEAQPTGLGSGQDKGAEGVRQDIRQFDALMLGATLRQQLFGQLLWINGRRGRPPKVLWGSATEEAKINGALLSSLAQAGLTPTDEALGVLSERVGFGLQRATPTAAPGFPLSADLLWLASGGLPTQADDANRQIARGTAAALAQAFRGSLAPVRQIILASSSPAECESRIRSLFPDWTSDRIAPILEKALSAHAGNATLAVQK